MVQRMVYAPSSRYVGLSRHTKGAISGKGVGTLLLDGGLGGGSSYSSIDDYISTTGRSMGKVAGNGLGKSLIQKLGKLNVEKIPLSRKPKNINFSL
jgi:hypothetical protein